MALITFDDKVDLTVKEVPEVNKLTAANINELKLGINTNETNIADGGGGSENVEFFGVVRFIQASATWELLDDAFHTPQNIDSIESSSGTNGFKINPTSPSSQDYVVGTCFIAPDESLAKSGLSAGASFGFTQLTVPVVQNQGFGFYMNGDTILQETTYIVPAVTDVSFDVPTQSMTMEFTSMSLTQGAGLGASNFNFTVQPSTNANFWFIRHDINYSTNGVKLKLKFYDLAGNLVTPTGRWYFNRTQPWQPLNNVLDKVGPNANFWVYGIYKKNVV